MYKEKGDLPESLRAHLNDELQEIYLRAYQKSWEEYDEEEGGDLDREGVAHRDAMTAVQQDYVHDNDTGKWYRKDELPENEEDKEPGEMDDSMNQVFSFLASSTGRWVRAVAGIVLIAIGLWLFSGIWRWVLIVVGLVPLAAGLFDFCVFAPLFRLPFIGERLRDVLSSSG